MVSCADFHLIPQYHAASTRWMCQVSHQANQLLATATHQAVIGLVLRCLRGMVDLNLPLAIDPLVHKGLANVGNEPSVHWTLHTRRRDMAWRLRGRLRGSNSKHGIELQHCTLAASRIGCSMLLGRICNIKADARRQLTYSKAVVAWSTAVSGPTDWMLRSITLPTGFCNQSEQVSA